MANHRILAAQNTLRKNNRSSSSLVVFPFMFTEQSFEKVLDSFFHTFLITPRGLGGWGYQDSIVISFISYFSCGQHPLPRFAA